MIDMIAKMLYKVLQIVLDGFEIMSHKKLCQFFGPPEMKMTMKLIESLRSTHVAS